MNAATIKAAIKTNLDELVTEEVLAGATVTDLKKNQLSVPVKSYPHAFLMPPSIESEALDNRTNLRTYTFDIMVLWKGQNLASSDEVEEDIEAILSKFDNDPTMSGTAMGGVLPVSSAPVPYQHGTQELIMAMVQIQAKQHVSLTF